MDANCSNQIRTLCWAWQSDMAMFGCVQRTLMVSRKSTKDWMAWSLDPRINIGHRPWCLSERSQWKAVGNKEGFKYWPRLSFSLSSLRCSQDLLFSSRPFLQVFKADLLTVVQLFLICVLAMVSIYFCCKRSVALCSVVWWWAIWLACFFVKVSSKDVACSCTCVRAVYG